MASFVKLNLVVDFLKIKKNNLHFYQIFIHLNFIMGY